MYIGIMGCLLAADGCCFHFCFFYCFLMDISGIIFLSRDDYARLWNRSVHLFNYPQSGLVSLHQLFQTYKGIGGPFIHYLVYIFHFYVGLEKTYASISIIVEHIIPEINTLRLHLVVHIWIGLGWNKKEFEIFQISFGL